MLTSVNISLKCLRAEIDTTSRSAELEVTLENVDLNVPEVYDAVDVDSFLEHHGIERAED